MEPRARLASPNDPRNSKWTLRVTQTASLHHPTLALNQKRMRCSGRLIVRCRGATSKRLPKLMRFYSEAAACFSSLLDSCSIEIIATTVPGFILRLAGVLNAEPVSATARWTSLRSSLDRWHVDEAQDSENSKPYSFRCIRFREDVARARRLLVLQHQYPLVLYLDDTAAVPTNKYRNGAKRGASCSGVMIRSGIHSVAFSFTSSWTIFSLSCTAALFRTRWRVLTTIVLYIVQTSNTSPCAVTNADCAALTESRSIRFLSATPFWLMIVLAPTSRPRIRKQS